MPSVTVITPTRNSSALIHRHYREVTAALQGHPGSYEILYVDDGSLDGSQEIISALGADDDCVQGLLLDRSYGQQTALTVGLAAMGGRQFVSLDVDLEIPSSTIVPFIEALSQDADYVVGRRVRRAPRGAGRHLGSAAFNVLMRRITGHPLSDFGCGASAGTRELVERAFQWNRPFHGLRDLMLQVAKHVAEIAVEEVTLDGHHSSYGLGQLYRALVVEHRRRTRLDLPAGLVCRESRTGKRRTLAAEVLAPRFAASR